MHAYLQQLLPTVTGGSSTLAPKAPEFDPASLAAHLTSFPTQLMGLVLTAALIGAGLYFLRISAELGKEAQRRARTTRAFLERAHRYEQPAPVVGQDVDEVQSLAGRSRMAEAS